MTTEINSLEIGGSKKGHRIINKHLSTSYLSDNYCLVFVFGVLRTPNTNTKAIFG